jgi:hypothetical protein
MLNPLASRINERSEKKSSLEPGLYWQNSPFSRKDKDSPAQIW